MKKNKYLLFLLLLIAFLATAGAALALEVRLPWMPENPSLPQYVKYIFNTLIGLAAALSAISFTVGAVGLISPNLETHNDAKDRMKSAILGLVLTMASFMIIRTINPALETIQLTPLPGTEGVFYYNRKDKTKAPVSSSVPDASTRPAGYDELAYCCKPDCKGGSGPALLIWKFPYPGLETGNNLIGGSPRPYIARINCGETTSISGLGSFSFEKETPGVYFCNNDGCSGDMCFGYMSGAITSIRGKINQPFQYGVRGIRIVNDTTGKYGAIFHETGDINDGARCTFPIISSENITCLAVPEGIETWSVDIFKIVAASSTVDDIKFYSEPFGEDVGTNAGVYSTRGNREVRADQMCFSYTGSSMPPAYMYKCPPNNKCSSTAEQKISVEEFTGRKGGCSTNACESFQDCPSRIEIRGDYLVALYAESDKTTSAYCKTYTKNDEGTANLKAQPILPPGTTKKLDKVFIIPIY